MKATNADKLKAWCEAVERAKASSTYGLEGLLMEVGEQIIKAMDEKGITVNDIASKLKVSPEWVEYALECHRGMTLKALVKLANAVDMRVKLTLHDKKGDSSAE